MPSEERAPTLAALQQIFRLSDFETNVVLLCAGYAMDATITSALVTAPTFELALAKFPDGHLDATAATSPLRLHRLVVLGSGDTLRATLSLDDRIWQFLCGVSTLDERLLPYLLPAAHAQGLLPPSHQPIAASIERTLGAGIVQVFGGMPSSRLAVIHAATVARGLTLLRLRGSALGLQAGDLDVIVRTFEREVVLANATIVIELDDDASTEAIRAVRTFADACECALVIAARDAVALSRPSTATFEVPRVTSGERRRLWGDALGSGASRFAQLDRIAHQFVLHPAEIVAIARGVSDDTTDDTLWEACRIRSRPTLDDLARRIEPVATWDKLVLPPRPTEQLHDIVAQLRHRHAVHDRWGFARGDARGQAITALFYGPSGTGKTLAVEVIARETRLDLLHIDLSSVVDKYIGETEKRLRRIFDATEAGGAILMFDEADALFGKRANVERGTDRWANLEVSYLLQRMESYRGLAILTTNAKDALDSAFLRRLRFVVPFPFPDVEQRVALWERVFPRDAPTRNLDVAKLARLKLTGANIQSVAIHAAFYAANEGAPVEMRHIARAARAELAKLELPFPEADVRAWLAPS